jgi:hypothetical protein
MEFDRELQQPRRCCTDNSAEIGIVDFAVHRGRAVKLRVIEYIERFHPNNRKSAKALPVSVPSILNIPLNVAFGSSLLPRSIKADAGRLQGSVVN